MKIPDTWRRVEGASCEPERLEFEIPCTERQAAIMEMRFQFLERRFKKDLPQLESIASKPGAVSYMSDGSRKFERCDGEWLERRRIRNPDYVQPPFFQIVYGIHKIPQGGCFFCKFPPGMKTKVMMSAITKVARSYGHSDRGENRFLLMGCDQEMWDSDVVDSPRYEWDGDKLALVENPAKKSACPS